MAPYLEYHYFTFFSRDEHGTVPLLFGATNGMGKSEGYRDKLKKNYNDALETVSIKI